MRRMTCRNGSVFMAAFCLGLMVPPAWVQAGSLYPPAGPTSSNSAMWTLEDIYKVLDTRTTNVTKRTSFAEPTGGPTNGTMHTLNDIMTLAKRAPVSKTGMMTSYTNRDDGALQLGVAWPNPRFSPVATNGAETNQIRDNLTGLIWARDAANACGLASASTNWEAAMTNCITNCNNIAYGGTNDWRVPNVRELHSLVAFQFSSPALSDGTGTNQWTAGRGPFTGVQSSGYWTSTPYNAQALRVNLQNGDVINYNTPTAFYVWPVRGGQ